MKKTNLAAIALATFLLASCGTECETKECWDSKASYESAKASNDDAAKEAAHRRNIEALNARAAAEASKPESVRIQEAKNEEPDFGDKSAKIIGTIGAVGVGAYVIGKMFE